VPPNVSKPRKTLEKTNKLTNKITKKQKRLKHEIFTVIQILKYINFVKNHKSTLVQPEVFHRTCKRFDFAHMKKSLKNS